MTRSSAAPETSAASTFGERVVVIFLLIAALAEAWVLYDARRDVAPAGASSFDIRNPMLRAQVGTCVEAESTTRPGDVTCMRVVEPGVVLRPHQEPGDMVPYGDLRRVAPYLAVGLRPLPPGKGCGDDVQVREAVELFPLGGYGMPASTRNELTLIRPMWVQRGGRYQFLYEFQMRRYGFLSGPVVTYLDPDFPVTGVVLRKHGTDRGQVHDTIFVEAEACR